MRRFPGHRLVRLLRLPALALLVLAVLINPVLAAVGDLHESSQGAAHLHDVGDHDHDHGGIPEEQDDGDGDLLHALMHASHCCGHPTAMPSSAVMPAVVALADAVPALETTIPHLGIATDHFRPPIAA